MAAQVYDYIVLGAGVHGLFTALQLLRHEPGAKTLVLEQFDLGHARGSSHGASRIIRKAYTKLHYSQMMDESFSMWESLSREAGIKLITPTGLLILGPPDDSGLQTAGVVLQQTPGKDQAARVPSLNPHASYGLWDEDGGVLHADNAVKALLEVVRQRGGEVQDGSKVIRIQPGSPLRLEVEAMGWYTTRALILTPGAWAGLLLKQLGLWAPLKVIQVDVCYWREKEPGQHSVENGFPCIIHFNSCGDEKSIYALPPIDYPHLVKLCGHFGMEVHPDTMERHHDAQSLAFLSAYVANHLPNLDSTPACIDSCLYTNTPDADFIIDKHPRYDNIIIGAGFSGHGFKLAPVVGKLLSELASGRHPSYKLTPFRIGRFALKANL
uniref:peroxisomal sarcosine oxidase isoform X2 n=1 Tax=Myxine glutinosa TaxID=7769 RepID=UPI00359011ED